MDRQRLITTLIISGIFMLVYFTWLKPNQPPAAPTASVTATGTLAANEMPIFRPVAGPNEKVEAADAPQTIMLGDANSKLTLTISNVGAGIDRVELNPKDYRKGVNDPSPFVLMQVDPAGERPFTTEAVRIDDKVLMLAGVYDLPKAKGKDTRLDTDVGVYWDDQAHVVTTAAHGSLIGRTKQAAGDDDAMTRVQLDDWIWRVESATPTQVRMTILLGSADKPVGKLIKVFEIDPASYNVSIRHELENYTGQPMKLSVQQLGPSDLSWDSVVDPRVFETGVIAPGSASNVVTPAQKMVPHTDKVEREPLGTFKAPPPHLVWVAGINKFFTVIERPIPGPGVSAISEPTPYGDVMTPDFLGDASVEKLGERTIDGNPWRVLGIRFSGNTVMVPAGTAAGPAKAVMPLAVFMGPKDRALLAGDLTAAAGTPAHDYKTYQYLGVIQIGSGMCSFCTFAELSWVILRLLDFIHSYVTFGNYGLAIMVLVVVVRLILHPLTRYSQISMNKTQRRMAKIQPEIERIKKKYSKDKQQQNAEVMKVWKEHGVNPAGGVLGCLPMFIQTPIWLALYAGLSADIDLRHKGFIPHWITDLTSPDTIMKWATSFKVPVFGITVEGHNFLPLNILPLLLGIVFFINMRIQMKTMIKPADDQQAQTQKFSQYMTLLFPVFLYNSTSGLNLYIFASTLGGIFDTWLVRKQLRKMGLIDPPAGKVVADSEAL